ncbi:MAG: PKD domain-containing protein, partial [Chitinophagia bacterium]|nr:PKD domain-containing protein [Chitinophagia bacterium]
MNFRPQQPYDPANTYLWNLGRGPTTNQYAPVGVYPGTGTYSVSLVITQPNGTRNTYYETIQVYPKPDVRFSADDTAGCFPHHVGFQDLTVPGTGSIVSRSWFFGDGNTATGSASPRHIYGSYSNLYSVTLRVVQSVCPLDTFTLTRSSYIRVYEGIRPDFLVPPPTACRTPVDLSPVNLSTSGPAQTLTYRWTIPGATPSTSTAREPDIRFGSTGDFPARLVVRSDSGCVDSIEKTIRISNVNFRSDFSFSADTICQGLMVDFLNKSTPTPDTSFWYFGEGQAVYGLHQYLVMRDTGLVKVKLVNRFGNCMDSATRTIYVKPAPNIVVSSPNRFGCRVPRTVDFSYTGAPPSSIRKLEWEFGDGRTFSSSGPSATNTFNTLGSYPLSLTVTDIYGCIRRSILDSFVVIGPPRITAENMVDSGCVNLVVRPKAQVIAPDAKA